jgi:hypothetical protein
MTMNHSNKSRPMTIRARTAPAALGAIAAPVVMNSDSLCRPSLIHAHVDVDHGQVRIAAEGSALHTRRDMYRVGLSNRNGLGTTPKVITAGAKTSRQNPVMSNRDFFRVSVFFEVGEDRSR